MARKAKQIRNRELAQELMSALKRGAFAPPDACKVMRSLRGHSQMQFASRLGLSLKVIKSLESGRGNVGYRCLERVASAAGMRVAFIDAKSSVEILDPRKRLAEEFNRRRADAHALASGKISESQLHKRNAMPVEGVEYELPELV